MRQPLTLTRIRELLDFPQLEDGVQAPAPFPGRRFPTRVAFNFIARRASIKMVNGSPREVLDFQGFRYIGKPNRLRAASAMTFLARWRGHIAMHMEVEFDRAGIVAARYKPLNGDVMMMPVTDRYFVYHPQAQKGSSIINSFMTDQFMKRLGGFTVYSLTKRLPIEKVDAFYDWYYKVFGKKLRRPKGKPLEVGDDV